MTHHKDECNDIDSYDKKYENNLINKLPNVYYIGILKEDKRVKLFGLELDVFYLFEENIFNFKKNLNGEVDYDYCLERVVQSVNNQIKYKNHMKRR